MKRDFKFNRLWMACMIAGTALTFTACSDDDEPTPDEPKTEDVYGNYTGTMTFKTEEEVANEANESGETEGIAVSATVKNDTVYFEDFPVRDLVASIVGEELADALVEAIGTVNYKVGYKASMTTAKDSVYMEMSPKPLELSIPVDEENTMAVSVEVSAADKANYEFETQNLNLKLKAEKVWVNEQEFPIFPVTDLTFEMTKK